jgi:hypothetical protein
MDRSTRRSKARARGRGRERSRQIAVLAVVAAVVATGLFATGGFKIAQSPSKPASAPSDDEVYTGSILYVPDEGKVCRQLLFDNRTGRMQDNGMVDCERAYYRGASETSKHLSTARALVISESFRQH